MLHRSSAHTCAPCHCPAPCARPDGLGRVHQSSGLCPEALKAVLIAAHLIWRAMLSAGGHAHAGGHADAIGDGAGLDSVLLTGIHLRAVRKGARGAAERGDALPPALPYGVAKLYGFWAVKKYRRGLHPHHCCDLLPAAETMRRCQHQRRPGASSGRSLIATQQRAHGSRGAPACRVGSLP